MAEMSGDGREDVWRWERGGGYDDSGMTEMIADVHCISEFTHYLNHHVNSIEWTEDNF